MARLGVSKKKKSPRATELSQLKKEVQRVTEQLESCKRELAEATERETATGEILRVIASSPTEIQPVLDVVAENAAKLCDADDGVIVRPEGDSLRRAGELRGSANRRFSALQSRLLLLAGPSSTAKQFISTICKLRSTPNFLMQGPSANHWSSNRTCHSVAARRCGHRVLSGFGAPRFGLSPRSRLRSSRPSPTRQ